MHEQPFEHLAIDVQRPKLILLDVDGTLLADYTDRLAPEVIQRVKEMQKQHSVVLCTNSKDERRNKKIAESLPVPLLSGNCCRKPSKKILDCLPADVRHLEKIVIGDKFLTDGILAWRIGALFVKVQRKTGNDRLLIRWINAVDDLIYHFLQRWQSFSS